jgi:hypothetical protein
LLLAEGGIDGSRMPPQIVTATWFTASPRMDIRKRGFWA